MCVYASNATPKHKIDRSRASEDEVAREQTNDYYSNGNWESGDKPSFKPRMGSWMVLRYEADDRQRRSHENDLFDMYQPSLKSYNTSQMNQRRGDS